MPYNNQVSPGHILRRIASDPENQDYLSRIDTRQPDDVVVPPASQGASASDWLPHNVVAIDGSWHPYPLENGYPGAEISYNAVVSVLLKIKEMVDQDQIRRPMDPAIYRSLTPSDAITTILPGHNVMLKGTKDPRFTFREKVYTTLDSKALLGQSLLNTYEGMLARRIADGDGRRVKCAWNENCDDPNWGKDSALPMPIGTGCFDCPCASKKLLMSTDALRLQESFNETGPSGRVFGEAQAVLEHLWLVTVIKTFVRHRTIDALNEMAFVMDGTLKIDGTPSWLAAAIRKELRCLNEELAGKAVEISASSASKKRGIS